MTKFVSTVRKESTTFPGVFYTLNKMSEARRSQLRLKIAEPNSQIRLKLREMERIEKEYPELEARPEELMDQILALAEEMDEIQMNKIDPEWIRWGLKSVEGLEIDDEPATPELLISAGPPKLFSEILGEIKAQAQLNGEEEKNSESPTTSGQPTDGKTNDTSAELASSSESSEPETASISQT